MAHRSGSTTTAANAAQDGKDNDRGGDKGQTYSINYITVRACVRASGHTSAEKHFDRLATLTLPYPLPLAMYVRIY